MKVGIDSRLLSRPITGIGRYTLELCKALSQLDNVSLYLYSPAPISADVIIDLESPIIKTGNLNNGFLRQLWSESYLPMWARADEVDVFWGPCHRLPYWLPKDIARVVTIHDLVWKYAGSTMRPLSRLLESFQMPLAVHNTDEVVADSQATADAVIREFNVELDKLNVVSPGVNSIKNAGSSKKLKETGIDRPFFLFVGTLEPRKNITRLLMAYSQLPQSIKDKTNLVIAGGDGWGCTDIKEVVVDLNLVKFVHVLGYVDEQILNALYANAQFLAMPSLYEGFGLPLVEAMVHGTPVLTANNSSMPEVAGDAGLLIDAQDVESIKSGLELLITNDKIRNQLAANAKSNAARYNWDESALQLIGVFEKAISTRKNYIQ